MAGPLIPIALLVAGMLANKQANDAVARERSNKLGQERVRQKELQDQADAAQRQELEQQSRPAIEQDQNQQAAERQAKYDAVAPTVDSATASYAPSASAPTQVKSQLAGAVVDALRRGRRTAVAQAKLGGIGDASQNAGFGLQRGGQELNSIGNRSRSSSNILPFELQDANQAGEGWRTIGDAANLASMGYGLYSMTTPPVPGANNPAYMASTKNPLFSH